MTIHLIALGLIGKYLHADHRTSMMPTSDGTTIMAAPRLVQIDQAADVSVMERRNLLVATDILRGAPIRRSARERSPIRRPVRTCPP